MPHFFVIDARFSLSRHQSNRLSHNCPAYQYEAQHSVAKSRRETVPSGSISISSLGAFPASPVNRFAQSMGPERPKRTLENSWTTHPTPMNVHRPGHVDFNDAWETSYAVKSNRRSVWRRLTNNIDKCVVRVVSKFYK